MTTSTLTATSGILDSHAMKFLAGCQGPCITIVVPAHHPGAQEGSRQALVHGLVRTAGEQMTSGKLADRAADLLAPLEEIAQESGVEAGGAGFAIFRSPEYTARYYLPEKPGKTPVEKLVIADHFYLAPFVADAFAPHEFFVLGLSTETSAAVPVHERGVPGAAPAGRRSSEPGSRGRIRPARPSLEPVSFRHVDRRQAWGPIRNFNGS